MSKQKVVITKNGFLTSKAENQIDKSDTVICETNSNEESEKIIHGKQKINK
jgi:hypothetical protein